MSTPTSFAGRRYRAPLFLVALGVVYGDIGTSPLYAMRECFYGPHAVTADAGSRAWRAVADLLGTGHRHLAQVPRVRARADNHGEGGILALTALATPITPSGRTERSLLILLGVFGAALLYGDGIITPAISVLGAMEGLSVATPVLQALRRADDHRHPHCAVLVPALRHGRCRNRLRSHHAALVHGAGDSRCDADRAAIRRCWPPSTRCTPWSFSRTRAGTVLVLGSVFLVVTGGEALYADMGHFGTPADSDRLVRCRLALTVVELLWSGCAAAGEPRGGREPVLSAGAVVGDLPDDPSRRGRGRHCLAGGDLRGVFADHAGGPARIHAPACEIDHTSGDEYGQIYMPESTGR